MLEQNEQDTLKAKSEREAILRKAIALNPQDANAHAELGYFLNENFRQEESEPILRKAIELDSKHPIAYASLGACLNHLRRIHEAETFLRKAIDLLPTRVNAYSNLGACLLEQGRPNEAEVVLRKAIEVDPSFPTAYANLGACLFGQKRYREAIPFLEKAVELRPNDGIALICLGNCLGDLGLCAEAIQALSRAVSLLPNHVTANILLGRCLNNLARYEEAEEVLRRATELDTSKEYIAADLGTCLAGLGRHEEAADLLQEAITADPTNVNALSNLGMIYISQGRYSDAELVLRRAKELCPDDAVIASNLGACLSLLDNRQEAEAILRRSLEANPGDAVTYLNLGIMLNEDQRHVESEPILRKAIDLNPNSVRAHIELSISTLKQARSIEALEQAKRAVELDSNNAKAQEILGTSLSTLNRYDKAIFHFEKSVTLDPFCETAHSNLGVCYANMSRLADADAAFRRAVALKPSHTPANLLIARIQHHLYQQDSQICRLAEIIHFAYLAASDDNYISSDLDAPECLLFGFRRLKPQATPGTVAQSSLHLPQAPVYALSDVADAYLRLDEFITLYQHHNDNRHLHLAIERLVQAREVIPTDDPKRPKCLSLLAQALFTLFRYEQDEGARKRAFDICKQLLENGDERHLRDALEDALEAATVLFKQSEWLKANEMFSLIEEVGQRLREMSPLRAEREGWLAVAQKAAPMSAYSLHCSGDDVSAVVALERGLASLMRDELSLRELDLVSLRANGHVSEADVYEKALLEWNSVMDQHLSARHFNLAGANDNAGSPLTNDLSNAHKILDSAISAVRALGFLQSVGTKDILKASKDVPLVYLTYTTAGGLAFIAMDNTESIALDGLTDNYVEARLRKYLSSYGTYRLTIEECEKDREASDEALVRWLEELDDILAWLWQVAIGPVVAELKKRGIRKAVFIGGGLLRHLPLHAAYHVKWWDDLTFKVKRLFSKQAKRPLHGPRRRYALEEITFAAAPSAYSLLAARRVKERLAEQPDRLLAYRWIEGDPTYFKREWCAARQAFPRHTPTTNGEKRLDFCSKEAFKASLRKHTVVQFAGHGKTDFDNPLEGAGLRMTDEDGNASYLKVKEFLKMQLGLRACVLSACEGGLQGRSDLAHESVGLPASLLQAGAASVVAPLWIVDSRATSLLLQRFYEEWQGKDKVCDPAQALRAAQLWLKDGMTSGDTDGSVNFLGSVKDGASVTDNGQQDDGMEDCRQMLSSRPSSCQPSTAARDNELIPPGHPYFWAAFSCEGE